MPSMKCIEPIVFSKSSRNLVYRQMDRRTDQRTDRHLGESSIPPFHLQWSGGIIISIYPDSKDPQIDIDWTHPETLVSDRCLIDVDPRFFAIWVPVMFLWRPTNCLPFTSLTAVFMQHHQGHQAAGLAGQLAKLTLTTHQLLLYGTMARGGWNMKMSS